MTRRRYHEGSMLCPRCGQPRGDRDGAATLGGLFELAGAAGAL